MQMRGLVLVTGINYSGKTSVLAGLASRWNTRHPARFVTASREFIARYAPELGYDAFKELPPESIAALRSELFHDLAVEAKSRVIFLDTHLVLDTDQDPVDYAGPFHDVLRYVLVVVAHPEDVRLRHSASPEAGRPGRHHPTDPASVLVRMRREVAASGALVQRIKTITGHSVPRSFIFNVGQDRFQIECQVATLLPALEARLALTEEP